MPTPTLAQRSACCARPLARPPRRRALTRAPLSAAPATPTSALPGVASDPVALMTWLVEEAGLPPPAAEPTPDGRLVAARAVGAGEVRDLGRNGSVCVCVKVLGGRTPRNAWRRGGGEREQRNPTRPSLFPQPLFSVPGDLAVTAVDAASHPAAGPLVAATGDAGVGDIVALALWLAAERASASPAPLAAALPLDVDTPVLWPDAVRADLLRGSPVLQAARDRDAALDAAYESVVAGVGTAPAWLTRSAFRSAVAVVTAHAAYLPSAGVFALLPIISGAARTGNGDTGALLDYEDATGAAVLRAPRPVAAGAPVSIYDGRPNGELVLATGTLEDGNPADCLTVRVGLVPTDRLRNAKLSILEAVGLADGVDFPVTATAMPLQLLGYLRLARVADSAALASVSFDADVVVSPANEYEVLQLLLNECKERLTTYGGSAEDDTKLLQDPRLSPGARLAARLRLGEKRILQGTLDAVRRRLAPIRGVPMKDGTLRDANADFVEIFDAWAAVPAAPKKLVDGLLSWARGDNDPEFQKKWGKKK